MDTKWWTEKLRFWSEGSVNGIEYPIVSANDLMEDLKAVTMIASDASGSDGFGYYWGEINAQDFSVYAKRWGGKYEFVSSHTGELQALQHYLEYKFDRGSKVLIWITDCLSAMFTVNKGRCREESGLRVLEYILDMCDDYKVQLIALWVPRECNAISDFLSHLCVIMNREEYHGGSLRDLQISESEGSSSGQKKRNEGGKESQSSLSKLVYQPGIEFIPKGV
jgi:hypothetical protein